MWICSGGAEDPKISKICDRPVTAFRSLFFCIYLFYTRDMNHSTVFLTQTDPDRVSVPISDDEAHISFYVLSR